MTKKVLIIGYPLKHSISPLFQQAALDHYQLAVRYEALEVEPYQLEATLKSLRQPSVIGANITIPHKEAVITLLDEIDEIALEIGAVNTIVNRDGRLSGYNTDAPAFIKALRQDRGFKSEGKRAILLGAGGVARAVGFALVREEVRRLTIANRNLERAEKLVASLVKRAGSFTEITSLLWDELEQGKVLSEYDLIVNCTSIGMRHSPMDNQTPLKADLIPKDALVCDLVYNPMDTPLLGEAEKAGAYTLGGLAMLIYQGAASFRLWLGREAPLDIMFKRAREALE